MLEGITWQQYLSTAALGAAAYYGYIAYRIYGRRLSARTAVLRDKAADAAVLHPKDEADEAAEALAELEHLVNTIRTSIFEKAGKQADKAELMETIKTRVASFGGLHRPAYRNALNNFIIKYGEELCGAGFSEEELEAAWNSLQR